jgi:hypothetical protein
MKDGLLEQARRYAERDEYHITRNYITQLCDEIERLRGLNQNVLSRIQDNRDVWHNSERYLWLRNSAWDVPENSYAPMVVLCDSKMMKYEWLDGEVLDIVIDKWRSK